MFCGILLSLLTVLSGAASTDVTGTLVCLERVKAPNKSGETNSCLSGTWFLTIRTRDKQSRRLVVPQKTPVRHGLDAGALDDLHTGQNITILLTPAGVVRQVNILSSSR